MNSFAEQTQILRKKLGYTMQELANRAKVSKSTICKIERGDVQPTLDIALRVALALGTTLSRMLHTQEITQITHLSYDKQSVWHDQKSNLVRRLISPVFIHSNIEWLHIKVPPHTSCGRLPALPKGSEKCYHILKGEILVKIGGEEHQLQAGDSLYFEADVSHETVNPTDQESEYLALAKIV